MGMNGVTDWIGGKRQAVLLLAVVALSAVLLFFDLGGKSLWIDEYNVVTIAAQPNLSTVTRSVLAGFQRQPPAYFWLLHLWIRLAGTADGAVRVLSVLMGLASVVLAFVLARQLDGPDSGLVAAFLLAISPTFVLYARMARYYMPTLFFGLLSCCLFLALSGPGRRRGQLWLWAGYTVANILLMLSSYVAAAVLGCQVVGMLLRSRWSAPRVRPWLATLVVSLTAVAAWYLYALPFVASYPLAPADYASGWSGYVVKLAYPFYSFAIGETLFPWRLPAILGGLVAVVFALAAVVRWRRHVMALAFVLVGLVGSIVAVVLSTVWFVVDVPFLNIPSRAFFALPFLCVLLAMGVGVLPRRWLKWAAMAALILCAGAGLSNYYRGLEFHNPIYAVPMREVVAQVRDELQPGDAIVSEFDTGFGYYYRDTSGLAPLWESDVALAPLLSERPGRIWLVTFGRDATRSTTNEELQGWIEQNYRLAWEQGYVEQDPLYQRAKELLLHRPAYRFKLLVQRYERP